MEPVMNHLRLVLPAAILLCGLTLQGGTRLSQAVVDGNLSQAQALVETGGEKVTEFDKWGWTPLHWAAYYGHPAIAEWLLAQGADPNAKTFRTYGRVLPGAPPIVLAGYYGHARIVKALLDHKADPAAKDASGMSALEYAQNFNFQACVELLKQP
jgi:ankyrin repeat protein